MIHILTRIHAVRKTSARPASKNNFIKKNIRTKNYFTYKKQKRRTHIKWVLVVALVSVLVSIWAWQWGHVNLWECGPYCIVVDTGTINREKVIHQQLLQLDSFFVCYRIGRYVPFSILLFCTGTSIANTSLTFIRILNHSR